MKIYLYSNKKVSVFVLIISVFIFISVSVFPAIISLASEDKSEKIPILMYHAVSKDPSKIGKYVVSYAELESDLKYLSDNSYNTISVTQLIEHVKNGASLPPKAILLSFDDGYYNNYCYAYELCKKYQSKMLLSIIVEQTDKYSESKEISPYYSHVTWEQINEMLASNLVEIANHSYSLHSSSGKYIGITKADNESEQEYEERITKDITKAQDRIHEMTGRSAKVFTYPFGLTSKQSENIVKKLGFEASLLVENKIASLTNDEECLFSLKRCIRPGNMSTASIMQKYKL